MRTAYVEEDLFGGHADSRALSRSLRMRSSITRASAVRRLLAVLASRSKGGLADRLVYDAVCASAMLSASDETEEVVERRVEVR